MAERKYIITADVSQATRNLNKLASALNGISEAPEGFQKNLYNALNKAQKDLVNAGSDVKKLGLAFSSLNQVIQKNLDFKNIDILPKEIINRFKDISAIAKEASNTFSELQKKTKSVSDSYRSLYQTSTQSISAIDKLKLSASQAQAEIRSNANSVISLSNASIKTSDNISKLSVDTGIMSTIMKELEEQLTNTGDRLNGLSNKANNAKVNLEVIRGELVKLNNINERIKDLSIQTRGIEQTKQNVTDLENRYKNVISTINKNKAVLKDLEEQYSSNKQVISKYIDEQNQLNSKMKELHSAGMGIPTDLKNSFEQTSTTVKTLNKNLEDTKKAINSIHAEQNKLSATANKLQDSLSRAKNNDQVSDATNAKLQQQIINLQSLARETKNTAIETRTFNSALVKQNGVLRLVGTQFRSLIYDLNAVRIAFILLASSTGIASVLRVIAEFDKSMARVRALMIGAGEATASLNVEYGALTKTVMSLGATTKFTAGEVAEGAVIITQAGYSAKESIEALKPTLDLAVAGQIDMAESADTLTKTIAMFQKQAGEAANVADIYAAAVNYSQTNMTELATAMSYVGPIAETFGLSLEETAGYLAVLANNGISASKAGTSLRQLMMNIQNPTKRAAEILDAYGLSLKELKQKGMDSEDALSHILTTLSEVGRLGNVIRVTALPSAEILGKSNEQLDRMVSLMQDVDGYASKVAENNMDNLHDQFVQLVSALQDTVIKFGEVTGSTDFLTNSLRAGADTLRTWNTDMVDLMTDLGLLGAVLLGVRGRWKSYKATIVETGTEQKKYRTILTKANDGYSKLTTTVKNTKEQLMSYNKSLDGMSMKTKVATVATKAYGTALRALSAPLALMAIEMAAFTAVAYGISKIVEYVASIKDMNDVLTDNTDLFEAAAKGGIEYRDALDAINASAKQMSAIQLTGEISKVEEELKIAKDSMMDSIEGFKGAIGGLGYLSKLNADMGSDDALVSIMAEQYASLSDILPDLMEAVDTGNTEELASVMAEIDPNALKSIEDQLGPSFKGLIAGLNELDTNVNAFKSLTDKLNALKGVSKDNGLTKLNLDLSHLLENLTLLKELSATDLREVFGKAENVLSPQLLQKDRFIPVDSFRQVYDEILKIEEGGERLARLLDFSREGGLSFNIGNYEEEIKSLTDSLHTLRADIPEQLRINGDTKEITAKIEKLEKLINLLQSYKTNLDYINESANQAYFLDIWQEASDKVDKASIEELAQSMVKMNEAGQDFRDNFVKNMGEEFLMMGETLGLLNKESIALASSFENIKIDNQPVYDYITAMREKIEVDKESNAQYENQIRYLTLLPKLIKIAFEQSQGKKRGRKHKEDDFYEIFLRSEITTGKATNALNGYNESLLKSYEITKRIRELQERNPKGGKYFDLAINSLKTQQAVVTAQLDAYAMYEQNFKDKENQKNKYNALRLDTNGLDLDKKYFDVISKRRALANAQSDSKLSKNAQVLKDLEKEYELSLQLYHIENERYSIQKQRDNINAQIDNNKMLSGGWFAQQKEWKLQKQAAQLEMQELNAQLKEIYTDLNNAIVSGESPEIERLNLLRQELELRKELVALQLQENNPHGFEGFRQAMRDYAQSVQSDAEIVKQATTEMFQSIESGLTEGIFAAMKQTEYDWSQFWDNLAKIFLEKALQMTVMRGLSELFNFIGNGIGGGLGGGGGFWSKLFGGGTKNHAKGGIIKSPTYMMGNDGMHRAGEAGAEAIMPLTRMSGGGLGIKADGAGKGAVNNNDFSIHVTTTGSSGDEQKDQKYIDNLTRDIKRLIDTRYGELRKAEYRQGGMMFGKR